MSTVSTTSVLSANRAKTELKSFGRASLADYFGDLVIYRNLEPLDKRLAGLKSAGLKMDITNERIPRKQDADYAKAAVWFARQAQQLRKKRTSLSELLFVGDTLYNDGRAFGNMRSVSGWHGACFIGSEELGEDPSAQIDEDHHIFSTNRWAALSDWAKWLLEEQEMHLDDRTAVIVDIDKTALGAKGRNDQVINQARLEGIYRTMNAVLGDNFDRDAFERHYAELNRSRYHSLTEDNQDYLAYICMVVNAGLIRYEEILQEVETDSIDNFEQFLRWVDIRLMSVSGGESLRQAHEAVLGSVRQGDPTPFKRFRRQEFITTVERMGNLSDDSPVEEVLESEITLTNEICEFSEWLHARGCLLLCLSDKPDEASCPDPHVSAEMQPVHLTPTHRVGASIADELKALGAG